MSDTKSPNTLKGILALVGAAVLALIAKFTGIDLTGGSQKGDAGTGSGGTTVADGVEPGGAAKDEATAPAPEPEAQEKPTPKAPAPKVEDTPEPEEEAAPAPKAQRDDTAEIRRLFNTQRSDVIVEAEGEVVHLLPDDNYGSRHQLFLVELSNGITLKLSHNIDLAPRVDALRKGDTIRFHGEYEWNDKGGVVHWTHRNTRGGSHEHGWLLHEGQKYW